MDNCTHNLKNRSKVKVDKGGGMTCHECLGEFVPVQLIEGELLTGDVHILVRGMELHEDCFHKMKIRWSDESSYQTTEVLQEVLV